MLKKAGALKAKLESYNSLKNDYDDALMMIELADEENDESMLEDCTKSVDSIESKIETLTISTLLSGEYDGKMPCSPFMPAQAARRLWTGRKCFSECTTAGANATATRFPPLITSTAMWQA